MGLKNKAGQLTDNIKNLKDKLNADRSTQSESGQAPQPENLQVEYNIKQTNTNGRNINQNNKV